MKKKNANARHSEIESYLSASWITSEFKPFCSPSIKPDPELTNLMVGFVLGQSYGDFYEKQKTQGVSKKPIFTQGVLWVSIFTQSQMKVSIIFELVKSLFCDGNAHCAAIDDDFINVAASSAQKLNGRHHDIT